MRIANPLYDHAFKYLMSNKKLAKKVISTILDEEVVSLELHQQEVVVNQEEAQFSLFRLDFKALIAYKDGRKEYVLIELQKSKLPTNMLRFRSYLGYSYAQKDQIPQTKVEEPAPYPIITIYILGYNLADIEVMATMVDRKIIDISTKEELHIESDFINLLTHKCYILQVRRLPEKRRTRLEKFMTLFNQAWISEYNYVLNLEEVPEEFEDIAAFLQAPLMDNDTRKRLADEAEANLVFSVQEARIKKSEQERDRAFQLRDDAFQQRDNAEQKLNEFRVTMVKKLYQTGLSLRDIALTAQLSESEVKAILKLT